MRVEEGIVRVSGQWLRSKLRDVTSVAAVLVAVAALLASLAWISSGKAGGRAGDLKTAALGFMMLRLETATESSNALVQAQSYLTQAGMYYAEADSTDDAELQAYLTDLGDQSIELSEFQTSTVRDAETRAQSYFDEYQRALDESGILGQVADLRSTAALILNVSATVASMTILLKRRGLLLLFAPVFFLGIGYLVASLF